MQFLDNSHTSPKHTHIHQHLHTHHHHALFCILDTTYLVCDQLYSTSVLCNVTFIHVLWILWHHHFEATLCVKQRSSALLTRKATAKCVQPSTFLRSSFCKTIRKVFEQVDCTDELLYMVVGGPQTTVYISAQYFWMVGSRLCHLRDVSTLSIERDIHRDVEKFGGSHWHLRSEHENI